MTVSHTKAAERIVMLFGMLTRMGPRNQIPTREQIYC